MKQLKFSGLAAAAVQPLASDAVEGLLSGWLVNIGPLRHPPLPHPLLFRFTKFYDGIFKMETICF